MLGSETDVKCTRAEEKQYSEAFYSNTKLTGSKHKLSLHTLFYDYCKNYE